MQAALDIRRPSICVASHHRSLSSLLADAPFRAIVAMPDTLVELRLDRYADARPEALRAALAELGPGRCVVTVRAPEEGGAAIPLAAREALWDAAIAQNTAYIDVELSTVRAKPALRGMLDSARDHGVGTVISCHDFHGVPALDTLRNDRRAAEAFGADVVKIAVLPHGAGDVATLMALAAETEDWTRPLLALAMGELGLCSRVLVARAARPPPFTFARADVAGTAPGQPTVAELRELYQFDRIEAGTPVYGVLGAPVSHSRSPHLHNAVLRHLHRPGVYLPFCVEGSPAAFLRELAPRLGVAGLSVTLPHKEAVMAACRHLDPLAERIGAVNTLVSPHDGRWVGYNTDAAAAADSLGHLLGVLRGRTVRVLGAGGVAKAVAHGVAAAGARVQVWGRTPARARDLAAAVGGEALNQPGGGEIDALVNATPVGMTPAVDAMPLPIDDVPIGCVVFDTIYTPAETLLVRAARARGHPTLGGVDMFLAQAAAQVRLFHGADVPLDLLRRAL